MVVRSTGCRTPGSAFRWTRRRWCSTNSVRWTDRPRAATAARARPGAVATARAAARRRHRARVGAGRGFHLHARAAARPDARFSARSAAGCRRLPQPPGAGPLPADPLAPYPGPHESAARQNPARDAHLAGTRPRCWTRPSTSSAGAHRSMRPTWSSAATRTCRCAGRAGRSCSSACAPWTAVTAVTGSTYLFDQQVTRFFASLPPAPPAPAPEALVEEGAMDAADSAASGASA